MTLSPGEFIRRFLLHVLPKGLHRIRHCGLLASSRTKADTLARVRAEPDKPEHPCPCCGGRMVWPLPICRADVASFLEEGAAKRAEELRHVRDRGDPPAERFQGVRLTDQPMAFLVTVKHTKYTSMFDWMIWALFSTGRLVHRVQEETFHG